MSKLSPPRATVSATDSTAAQKSIPQRQSWRILCASLVLEGSWIPVRADAQAMRLSVRLRGAVEQNGAKPVRCKKGGRMHRGLAANAPTRTPSAEPPPRVKQLPRRRRCSNDRGDAGFRVDKRRTNGAISWRATPRLRPSAIACKRKRRWRTPHPSRSKLRDTLPLRGGRRSSDRAHAHRAADHICSR